MLVLEIKLLNNQFGGCPWMSASNEGKSEIVPSPLRVVRAILSAFYQDSYIKYGEFNHLTEEQESIIKSLASTLPEYYLPSYRHTGVVSYHPDYLTSLRDIVVEGKQAQSSRRINFSACIDVDDNDSSIFVYFDIMATSTQRKLLKDAFEYLGYLGRSEYSAEWKLLRQTKVRPNCLPASSGEVVETVNAECEDLIHHLSMSPQQSKSDGYRIPPCLQISYYKLNAVRSTKENISNSTGGQMAVMSLDPESRISKFKRLDIADKLHRALVKLTDAHSQVAGKYPDGTFVEEASAMYIIPETITDGDYISSIKVVSRSRFDDEVVSAMKKLKSLFGREANVPTRLVGISDFENQASTRYRTLVPAFVSYEVRPAFHRTPEGQFINDICLQLGYTDKLKEFTKDGDYLKAELPDDLGWIKCLAYPVEESSNIIRGNRSAASRVGYYVVIETENPIDLISVGTHRRFGMGVLESF